MRWSPKPPLKPKPVAEIEGAVVRAERDRVDADPGALRRAPPPASGCRIAAGLGAVGEQDDRGGQLAVGASRCTGHRLHGDLRGVAIPSPIAVPGVGVEQLQALSHDVAVGRRLDEDVGLAAEGDEADLVALRHAVEERAHRGLGGAEPRRLHVARAHRARDVDQQHDRRALRRHGDVRLRPRHARPTAAPARAGRAPAAPSAGATSSARRPRPADRGS